MINDKGEEGSMSVFLKAAIYHPYTFPLIRWRISAHGKDKNVIGSISDLLLISQPLNAPFLLNNLVLPQQDELFNCPLLCPHKEGAAHVSPPSGLSEVLLMWALGVRVAGSNVPNLTLNSSNTHMG